jgi:hypothetical protein
MSCANDVIQGQVSTGGAGPNVPEPASVATFLAALTCLAVIRKRN